MHRGRAHIELPDGADRRLGFVGILWEARRSRAKGYLELVVEAKELRLLTQGVGAELVAEPREGGVARDSKCLLESDLPAGRALLARPIAQRALGQWQVVLRRTGKHGVHRESARRQRSCRGHELERRPGGIEGDDGSVDEGLIGIVEQFLVVVANRGRVVRRQDVGIEGRRLHLSEDAPRRWLNREDGTPGATHRGPCGGLRRRIDRRRHCTAPRLCPRYELLQPINEEEIGRAGEHAVFCALKSGGAVDQRVEPGDRGVLLPLGVDAQPLE